MSVLDAVIDKAKENLTFEYENEMNRLEGILDDNDRLLDELEAAMADLTLD